MTLGQRIQQLRKEKGMSQEALGDALGISRQAISKWESDLTIPEIDNLIAMSKLFNTPVGVLLGVEEDDPGNPAAEELTDRELEAIEAIVDRYLKKAQQPKPKRRIWPLVVGWVVVLFLVFWFKGQLETLNSRMSNLQNNINNISNNFGYEINSMTNQIQSILEQEASLLADCSYEVTSVDIANGMLLLDVQVTPKAYTEGMELIFTAEPSGEEALTAPGTVTSSHTFQVTNWEIPLNDEIKLSVTFGVDGNWQTQTLDTLSGYSSDTRLRLDVERSGQSYLSVATSNQGLWSVEWELYGYFHSFIEVELKPVNAQLQLRKNGTVLESTPLDLIEKGDTIYFEVQDFQKNTAVKAGDVLEYGIFYTDNYGRELFYSIECTEFQKDEAGHLEEVFVAQADIEYGSVYDAIYGKDLNK